MNTIHELKFKKSRAVKSPTRGTERSAGIDFYVPDNFNGGQPFAVRPGCAVNIPSGIHVNIPPGFAMIAFNKSGVALNKKLIVGACLIDEDYHGELHLHLINAGLGSELVEPGEKVAQFVVTPVAYPTPVEVAEEDKLYDTKSERGEGAFGSTGNR